MRYDQVQYYMHGDGNFYDIGKMIFGYIGTE